MHLSGLFIYPVKSLRGCTVESSSVDPLGLAADRRFLVVDETGTFLTQRVLPRLALIATSLDADTLTLSAESHGSVSVIRHSPIGTRHSSTPVTIWRSKNLLADDCGDDAATWLSDFLSTRCRLVRIGERFHRPVLEKSRYTTAPAGSPTIEGRVVSASDVFNFADGYPFMLMNESSVADLNDRLLERGEEPVPMNRFRPSLVVAGAPAFAEDAWTRVRIGALTFRTGGPCGRCIVTTTDQLTGERPGPEPLRTLATYRRDAADPSSVNLGLNLIHETKSGTLHLGDSIEPFP